MSINDIASVHLGRASDGTIVKPYETPDKISPELLVPVPRHLNRTQYEIDENNLPFIGYDSWNCYEFSCLLNNGAPISGLLKIVYPANSPNIVESKSLKLYLNSYNMVKLGDCFNGVSWQIRQTVASHLSECIGADVIVFLHEQNNCSKEPEIFEFTNIDFLAPKLNITTYNENKDLLEFFENKIPSTVADVNVRYRSSLLRSNCRVTNQPDWGDVFVYIESEKLVTPESFLTYIISMRNENHFHEEICECIYKRLWDLLEPKNLMVACLYTRRGGIDINPVRMSSNDAKLINMIWPIQDSQRITQKTMRQ